MPTTAGRPAHVWIEPAALAVLALACLALGGSSRADASALLVLRPIVVCCLMVFALRVTRARIATVRLPLLLLAAFAATVAVQLIPIPATLWAGLQGRALYANALAGLGLGGRAHPLSLTPDATWNSLIALLVPLAMLLGYAAVGRSTRTALLPALLIGGIASAVLGIAQLAAGPDSALYTYSLTHAGYPVGIFANRNHEAAFLAILFPALRVWAIGARKRTRTRSGSGSGSGSNGLPRTPIALAVGIFLVPMILATGSRAGFVLLLLGIGAAFAVAPVTIAQPKHRAQRWIVPAILIGIALLVVVTIASGRASTVQRLIANHDPSMDLRVAYLPTMIGLLHRFWLFGAGFGSFDPILRGAEPAALLSGMYFNNAHDDLIELILSGGVPSLLVLLAFLVWWARAAFAAFASPVHEPGVPISRAAASMIGMLLIASLVDYPLRTPLMGAVFALLCAWLYRGEMDAPGLPVASARTER